MLLQRQDCLRCACDRVILNLDELSVPLGGSYTSEVLLFLLLLVLLLLLLLLLLLIQGMDRGALPFEISAGRVMHMLN